MSLERWQRYLIGSPCPICGGISSGKKASRTLCKGYLHADEVHAFCQQTRSSTIVNVNGLVLYKHELENSGRSKSSVHKLDGSDVVKPKNSLPDPTKVVYGDHKGICVIEEVSRYEGRKEGKQLIPPFYKTWYVLMDKGVEITRDVSLQRMNRYLDVLVRPQTYSENLLLPSLESR